MYRADYWLKHFVLVLTVYIVKRELRLAIFAAWSVSCPALAKYRGGTRLVWAQVLPKWKKQWIKDKGRKSFLVNYLWNRITRGKWPVFNPTVDEVIGTSIQISRGFQPFPPSSMCRSYPSPTSWPPATHSQSTLRQQTACTYTSVKPCET